MRNVAVSLTRSGICVCVGRGVVSSCVMSRCRSQGLTCGHSDVVHIGMCAQAGGVLASFSMPHVLLVSERLLNANDPLKMPTVEIE